ncbi:hypothetical protein PM16_07 [Proteus phage PM16]|uniref:Uncharacterized protein n=1 Tax=Proteus phage PM16 TaxID=1357704 RepID=A0A0A6ZK65_9CAUD|nr:hypothetical protein ACQ55_gp07 [Proteus phage PM16]AGZ17252.1 hypothetical protein PM16_07 [Proteus phage PM16]
MKKKIKVSSINMEEVETLIEKGVFIYLCKGITPDNYDYKPKYIHYLQDAQGERLFITSKAYKELKRFFNE